MQARRRRPSCYKKRDKIRLTCKNLNHTLEPKFANNCPMDKPAGSNEREYMSLANVSVEGSWIRVYDENSKRISQMPSSNADLLGTGLDFFVTEEGSWIRTYDANCKRIAQMPSVNITVESAAGNTFTTKEGSWLRIYNKSCKNISQRPC